MCPVELEEKGKEVHWLTVASRCGIDPFAGPTQ